MAAVQSVVGSIPVRSNSLCVIHKFQVCVSWVSEIVCL